MTDEELMERLRSMHWCVTTQENGVGIADTAVAPAAADRIEELLAERKKAVDAFVDLAIAALSQIKGESQ